jgi:uncharacterized protein (DUF488 family)
MPNPITGVLEQETIKLFTIGFVQKTAREFFEILTEANIKRVIDIRLNNQSQLAGFTKRNDLEFFLEKIAGISYTHNLNLAPTKQILETYKKNGHNWALYEREFLQLINNRKIETLITPDELKDSCLLCSEVAPTNCHRRLVAEYLYKKMPNLNIQHL